jgi:predicted RNase H-like nuclease
MRFVGIDLAWSPRKRSGGAILSDDGQVLSYTSSLGDDDQVLKYVVEAIPAREPGLVAIDAPLAVPNETGGRTCDRQAAAAFRRFEAGPYLANRRNLGRYGGLRGEAITRRLETHGFVHDPRIEARSPSRRVIEVFPHPATVSLFDLERTLKYKARKGRDYLSRWRELTRLRDYLAGLDQCTPALHLPPEVAGCPIEGLRGQSFKEVEDLLDALVCAYAALYAWHHGPGGYAIYGDSEPGTSTPYDGHILVPMTANMWARVDKAQRV